VLFLNNTYNFNQNNTTCIILRYYKRQMYVQSKSVYEELIKDLFKNQIKILNCTQADFYDENARFKTNKYVYHFTDAESALSILVDGYIYPYRIDNYSNKQKFIELSYCYDFNDTGRGTDVDFMSRYFNFDMENYGSRPRVEKLEYAFGIKKKDLDESKIKWEHDLLRYNGVIELKNKKFILIVRNYTF